MYRFGELARPPAPATTILRLGRLTVMVSDPSIKIYNRSNDEAGGKRDERKLACVASKKSWGIIWQDVAPSEFAFRFS
jgi:hypothetical protein